MASVCPFGIDNIPDASVLTVIRRPVDATVTDYLQAMAAADAIAEQTQGECMLISWYDRDRDFESPQHASECHRDSALPGYAAYAIYHGATLKVDFDDGRFVFFYLKLDLG